MPRDNTDSELRGSAENAIHCRGCDQTIGVDDDNTCDECNVHFCDECSEHTLLECRLPECNNTFCDECNDDQNITSCAGCDRYYCRSHEWFACQRHSGRELDYCQDCYNTFHRDCDSLTDGAQEWVERGKRSYTLKHLDQYNSKNAGTIILSSRPFGIEIEAYAKTKTHRDLIGRTLPDGVGMSGDGSLTSSPTSFEIQTPPASGAKGEDLIINVGGILIQQKSWVDQTCGLHVHLDCNDFLDKTVERSMSKVEQDGIEAIRKLSTVGFALSTEMQRWYRDIELKQRAHESKYPPDPDAREKALKLKRAMALYVVFDDVIMSFLPRSRRDSRYCFPLKSQYLVRDILECENQKDIEALWYRLKNRAQINHAKSGKYHDTRYRGTNFHSLFKNGTVEIRYHSGTINPIKMLHWVALHQAILDSTSTLDEGFLYRNEREVSIEVKRDNLFGLIKSRITPATEDYLRGRFEKFERVSPREEDDVKDPKID